jgi:hypothetical protein
MVSRGSPEPVCRPRAGLAVALALALGIGCDAFYQVRGTVRSCAEQKPVGAAVVALRYPGEFGATQTNDAGEFRVVVNDPPGDEPAELVVAQPGYEIARKTVHHSVDESQDVCLETARARSADAGVSQ